MLRGIQLARESGRPYLGTCGGFQYALIELSRQVLGVADADTAESNSGSHNIVITPISCIAPGASGPRRRGEETVWPVQGTLLAELCGDAPIVGEYFCSYETNPDFVPRWEAAGLRVAGRGSEGELRAFELPAHPFFLATLFQPQLRSTSEAPHPIVVGLLRAALKQRG